jgi:glycosyltransferase involved in cell wall biosynthesis
MNSPKVTVIVTSYNQEDFIDEALASVAVQDYENFEILACDDGSTDGTIGILRDWEAKDDRIRVLLAPHNTGLSENRNRGLRASTGELVALLDGDDLMRPGKLTAQVAALLADPAAAGCLHDAEIFDSATGEKQGLFSALSGPRGLRTGGVELWLDPTYFALPSTMMIRASCIPAHHFDTRLPRTADWLFSIEVFRRGHCVVVDGVYTDYRLHDAQISRDTVGSFEEGLMVMALVDARYPELASRARTVRAAILYGEALRRFKGGQRADGVRFALSAFAAGGPRGHLRLAKQVSARRGVGLTGKRTGGAA